MEIKVNGARNWDTRDTTGLKTTVFSAPKLIVCAGVCVCV